MESENNRKGLSLWQVVVIGVAYMAPATVFDTFGIISRVTEGRVPLAYVLALIAMLLTAFSYARFSKLSPKSGSAYTYTTETCGKTAGFFVGWCSLIDYLLIPLVNVLLASFYLNALMPDISYTGWVIIMVGLLTLINSFRINILANFSFVFIAATIAMMLVFIFLVITGIGNSHGYGSVMTLTPLFNGNPEYLTLLTGVSLVCFSYLGFDAVSTLAHESKNPTKTIPRAIILTTLLGGIIFITVSWFVQLSFPSLEQFKNPDEALPEIALYVGGVFFQSALLTVQIMNAFASGLASHASASRLLYIMGRDGVFNQKVFGSVNARLGTPLYSIFFVGMISLLAIVVDLATVVSLVSFGALIAFTMVNFSVFMKFFVIRKERTGFKNIFFNLLLPLASVLCLLGLWLHLEKSALQFGGIWLVTGILLLLYKKLRKQPISFGATT
ncbi:putrescine/spermidine ABC transporter [Acinetobacter proteolyticus]|uniref:APC family permease n=1 Tax=Acinetobacter proteolyticus TaxID=1776741 RepID=UPI000863407E|nr:APC family permease [Acinetobacter proteolyticus]OEY95497.1 putrescine/spermidine ABC transporter [Acinetobacter proteolyticus]